MRDIIFRGKRVDNGEWVTGWYSEACFGIWPLLPAIVPMDDARGGYRRDIEVDPETVGQYTGYTDTNKAKIFEGDIVRVTDEDGESNHSVNSDTGIGIVEFSCGLWYIGGYNAPNNGLYDLRQCYYIEVIGNIHDNPELLK